MCSVDRICPFCEIVFNEDKIKEHIAIQHLGIIPEYTENQVHETKKSIELSVKLETADFLQCEYCGKRFLSEINLQKHQKSLHKTLKNSETNKKCKACKKTFLTAPLH